MTTTTTTDQSITADPPETTCHKLSCRDQIRAAIAQNGQKIVDNDYDDNDYDDDEDEDDDDDDDDEADVTSDSSSNQDAACAASSVSRQKPYIVENVTSSSVEGATGASLFADADRCKNLLKLLEEQQHNRDVEQKWWADNDSYNLNAFNQNNGVWPLEHPLPLPDWSSEIKDTINFDNVWQYEDLNALIEAKLHHLLEETHYDTIHLFVDFFKAFKKTRRSDLKSFFQFYDVPINRRHHMCVSLAMEIMTRITEIFPILANYMYIVSCEEDVAALRDYIETSEECGLNSPESSVEKEHAMVAMRISIGGRRGIMILDPGYHVARAVTVMEDQMYPHTGWFTQSTEQHCQREYCYNFSMHSNKYIDWMERETRNNQQTYKTSLVYIEHPYLTAIDVTVRRNLVYNFRSLLARDAKGRVLAGIYLPLVSNINEAHFTMFYDGPHDQRVKVKFMFNVFKNPTKIPEHVLMHLEKLAPQLNMIYSDLLELCTSLAEAVTDQDFIKQVLAINNDINSMSADN